METMMLIVDKSLGDYLAEMRGRIVLSAVGYPDSIHLHVKDGDGQTWKFFTWDADWVPSTPEEFAGRILEDAKLDQRTGVVRLRFDQGRQLVITPGEYENVDDPPYWQILTPDGQSIKYGPGPSWHVSDAHASLPTKSNAANGAANAKSDS